MVHHLYITNRLYQTTNPSPDPHPNPNPNSDLSPESNWTRNGPETRLRRYQSLYFSGLGTVSGLPHQQSGEKNRGNKYITQGVVTTTVHRWPIRTLTGDPNIGWTISFDQRSQSQFRLSKTLSSFTATLLPLLRVHSVRASAWCVVVFRSTRRLNDGGDGGVNSQGYMFTYSAYYVYICTIIPDTAVVYSFPGESF